MIPNFAAYIENEVFPFIDRKNPVTAEDAQLLFLPFYHIFGLGCLLGNLYIGVPTVALSHFKLEVMCQVIQDFKVCCHLSPSSKD